jgi:hypothetical protein
MKKTFSIILAFFLVVFAFTFNGRFVSAANEQSISCPRSNIPVAIDGKWGMNEWSDAAEVSLKTWSGYKSGEAFMRVKFDDSYFYAIIDFISVSTASGRDGASITFDTKNDGGNRAKADDYRFDVDYKGQGSMAQGTGSGFEWNLPLPENVLVNASIGASPHSSKNHPIYEFRIPLSMFPTTTTMGFAASVWQGWNAQKRDVIVLLTWPENYFLIVPNTWGEVNFPTPIPEFTSTFLVIASALIAPTLARIKLKKRE